MSIFNFNESVAIDLGFDLNQLYVLRYLSNISRTTRVETKIINEKECFHVNYSKVFKENPFVFDQVDESYLSTLSEESKKEYIKKIYDRNNKRFIKMLSGPLGKVIVKEKIEKVEDGKKIYFSINKFVYTKLLEGYPVKESNTLTDNEKIVIEKLNINKLTESMVKQLKNMDTYTLIQACEVSMETGILDFPYMKGIYNNLILNKEKESQETAISQDSDSEKIYSNNNNIPQNKVKYNKFNYSCNNTFTKYTPEELENILKESQIEKFK